MNECIKGECRSMRPAFEMLRCVHWGDDSIWLARYGLPYPLKKPYWCVVSQAHTEEPNCHEHYENYTEAETRFLEEEERLVAR